MKKLISLILISIIICDITVTNEDHVIPNLLMTKDQAKTQLLNSLRSSASKYKYPYPSNYFKLRSKFSKFNNSKI